MEKTHGSMTADPTVAYILVLSSNGWIIPLSEIKRVKIICCEKNRSNI